MTSLTDQLTRNRRQLRELLGVLVLGVVALAVSAALSPCVAVTLAPILGALLGGSWVIAYINRGLELELEDARQGDAGQFPDGVH